MCRSVFYVFLASLLSLTQADAQSLSNRVPLLDAELFGVDRSHSNLTFSVRFMGVTDVEGTFERYSAAILYDEDDLTRTSITLLIDASSIDTNNNLRDKDLRSERFLHVEAHPFILFQSKRIERTTDGFVARGDLTMRGVTREIAVPLTHSLQRMVDPIWGNVRIGFSGSTELSRTEFGVAGGSAWGVDLVSDEVRIDFSLLGTIMNMEKIAFSSREKPSIGEELLTKLEEEDRDAAIAHYHALKAEAPEAYNFAESQLNRLGYKLVQKQRIEDAVAIFRLNAEAYPASANVYSSLGEGYAFLGEMNQAVSNLTRSLELDPENPVALELLRHLE